MKTLRAARTTRTLAGTSRLNAVPRVDRFRLVFNDPTVEQGYQEDTRERYLAFLRVSLAVGLGLLCGYGWLDTQTAGDALPTVWTIRFGVLAPIVACAFFLTWMPFFRLRPNLITTLVTQAVGLGVLEMMMVIPSPGTSYYFGGLVTVMIFCCCVFRPHPWWAAANCAALFAAYAAYVATSSRVTELWSVNNLFFLAADAATVVFATYLMELFVRRTYAHETYDQVTGLLNREGFLRRANQLLKRDTARGVLSVYAIKATATSAVLDTFGQETAGSFLQTLAERLRDNPSSPELTARITNDTFAVAIDEDKPGGWSDTLHQNVGANVPLPKTGVAPDLAIGVAVSPDDGAFEEALLDNALSSATAAAQSGQKVSFYSGERRRANREFYEIAEKLRSAMQNNEFEVHYQPVINEETCGVVGAEALIRWNNPKHGQVGPGTFIPVAEETGLIGPIGDQVAAQVVHDLARTPDPGMAFFFNVAPEQVADPSFPDRITHLIREAGISPNRLELEMTERTVVADTDNAQSVFEKLKDLGVGISIDDFGTGYSGMSILRDLPFTKLKIDRSFVRDVDTKVDNDAISAALVALARGVGAEVVAEGVETRAEVERLRHHGCRLFQGFLYAKPMPWKDFIEFAFEWNNANCSIGVD